MVGWLRRGAWISFSLLVFTVSASAQTQGSAAQELLRHQEREKLLREQQEPAPRVWLRPAHAPSSELLPRNETPCFPIERIRLDGEGAQRFLWSLSAADPENDTATGRCLGAEGISVVMARVQNAVVARGFVTTRILASAPRPERRHSDLDRCAWPHPRHPFRARYVAQGHRQECRAGQSRRPAQSA